MKVQLDDKSKAEFIEHIAKDSITCWFDGDEFVMPSGQGRTARGIVLGKLLVWQHRQTEVDELQRRNQMLNDNIKEQGQKLVYQNEVIETQSEKLLSLRDEKAELQKRIDAAQKLFDDWNCGGMNLFDLLDALEQALKGGSDEAK
jgi:hypothetical protein